MTEQPDVTSLSLDDLRSERARLQADEDVVSYVRRLAQGRVDVVRAELRRRVQLSSGVDSGDVTGDLPRVLGAQVAAGSSRPPRDTTVAADHPLVAELDVVCDRVGFDEMARCSDDELGEIITAITAWERERSADRQSFFARIDALTAELVRRYRDGEASVDSLLADE
jgi:hypothetical protein